MDGWLNDNVELDQEVTGRIVAGVRRRAARRRRFQTATASLGGLCLVAVLATTLAVNGRLGSPLPVDGGRQTADGRNLQPSSLVPRPSPLDLSLSKVDHSVAITWEGNPQAEYTVYRCESPRFDTCSLADRVKGTQWVDTGLDSGTLTFYRVEPKG